MFIGSGLARPSACLQGLGLRDLLVSERMLLLPVGHLNCMCRACRSVVYVRSWSRM